MGGKAYSLLHTLTAPHRPAEKTFAEIVQVMWEHLSPKPLLIAKRFRFYKQNNCEGGTTSNFVVDLKLTKHCQFRNDILCERLVCGIHHEGIQKRLLTEPDLTFKQAVEITISMETAAKYALELQSDVKVGNVNKLSTVSRTNQTPCFRCGNLSHLLS